MVSIPAHTKRVYMQWTYQIQNINIKHQKLIFQHSNVLLI